jgi:hypothetical protein
VAGFVESGGRPVMEIVPPLTAEAVPTIAVLVMGVIAGVDPVEAEAQAVKANARPIKSKQPTPVAFMRLRRRKALKSSFRR